MTAEEIRNDWYGALENETGISAKIKWGFFPQDLLILCDLHEAGYFREKIIDLLEDCNFHIECGLIDDQKYVECRKLILDDMIDYMINKGR